MELTRSSGILLHITSLPSKYGIGDLGTSAYKFVDFLKASGHKYWQLLPLNPTPATFHHSPYSSYSAFAGNPLLVSPELLEKKNLVDLKKFSLPKKISEEKVNFEPVEAYKNDLLNSAYLNFTKRKSDFPDFKNFCKNHSAWLNDFALYKSLSNKYETDWLEWPEELRDRKPAALKKAEKELSEELEKEKFIQFLFFKQWEDLTNYAHKNDVQFIGDIPFYVNHESADCWANTDYFKLDEDKKPTHVSGVPPDYFSETGQLWGTPVFEWKTLKKNKYDWWVNRIKQNLLLFDLVRIDHFRAFAAYWQVPAGEETAINGKWVKSPGIEFFKIIQKEIPEMPFIAEDLGLLDEPVYDLLEKFNFPGMNVLQFAFGEEKAENPYLPFNHKSHSIAYTGTHDNNTTRGWFKAADKVTRRHLQKYADKRVTERNVHEILHRIVLRSVAKIAIFPLQDIIGLGEEAIMNTPGSIEGNWTWRVKEDEIPVEAAKDLREQNVIFGRFKEPKPVKKSVDNKKK
ncbi:4-alpha-glucanotransferase [Autumnicola edwardsiae]|uniref:4-alpha-glucanotransferase n=1 Tax=Autumnicola edwardsiae TaxID=3075594 RepID=A0ABU3CXK3_9FLAO|nr:4-alpha-glucanotransferase [Zunongwangia sp. F297]MDT0650937.1 4-alpha-glucanotransferase [Zunongwangia sp. F297]